MPIIEKGSSSRTSAQIALEDHTFHELFGAIWSNGGYVIESKEDLSWAILYKDMFLQALADYANRGFVKVSKYNEFLVNESAEDWVEQPCPFNEPKAVEMIRDKLKRLAGQKVDRARRAAFRRELERAQAALDGNDPFSFDTCCDVLGLDPDAARDRFKLYRDLKQKYGDKIRIVTYTGSKKNLNIPSIEDIIEAEEANGEHDLSLFLHTGIKRELRNRALARSKNERSNQRDSE